MYQSLQKKSLQAVQKKAINTIKKDIIKMLAKAPQTAAAVYLNQIDDPEEKAAASRILQAINLI